MSTTSFIILVIVIIVTIQAWLIIVHRTIQPQDNKSQKIKALGVEKN